MWKTTLVGLFVQLLGASYCIQQVLAVPYAYTLIDVPGTPTTFPRGINNSGQVTGGTGHSRGFLRESDGTYTPINIPGSSLTEPSAINDHGQIVGIFGNNTGFHGFVYSGGGFQTVDYPGANFTQLRGINNSGDIIGMASRQNVFTRGFLLRNGVFGDLPFVPEGINNRGDILGGNRVLDSHGNVTTLHFPPQLTHPTRDINLALALNDVGDTVGQAFFGKEIQGIPIPQGFLRDEIGAFALIEPPGAFDSAAYGINNSRQIIGQSQGLSRRVGVIGWLAVPIPELSSGVLLLSGLVILVGLKKKRFTWTLRGRSGGIGLS
jgi:probable HAF family extracellular repeat protein